MTPDELRALADEMQSNIDEVRIILRGKITVEDKAWFAMHDKAIDYLRACADVQPVAWLRPENRVEEECTARTRISIGERCPPIGTWRPLYTHPAPAAPQAEPKREPLTDERIASVCLSYRHDFGLLSGDEQAGLMLEARAWERAFRKEWQR